MTRPSTSYASVISRSGIAAAMFAFASAAAAQYGNYGTPAQTRVPEQQQTTEQAVARTPTADVYRAAACVVGRDANGAGDLLVTSPFSREERREVTGLLRAAQRCVRARDPIVTAPFLFRGAVAEALYEAQFTAAQAARVPAIPATPTRLGSDVPAESAAPIADTIALGECTVANQAEGVRAVLATEVASEAELTSLRALSPTFSNCLTAGSSMNADRTLLRVVLSESLFRWSAVQRDGAASPWAMAAAAADPTQPQ